MNRTIKAASAKHLFSKLSSRLVFGSISAEGNNFVIDFFVIKNQSNILHSTQYIQDLNVYQFDKSL